MLYEINEKLADSENNFTDGPLRSRVGNCYLLL